MSTRDLSPLGLLKAGRARIADERAWTKDTQARNAAGEAVFGNDPTAVQWSGYGVIYAEPGAASISQSHARYLLQESIPGAGLQSLTMWHDANERTHAEVLGVFDNVIDRIEAQKAQAGEP